MNVELTDVKNKAEQMMQAAKTEQAKAADAVKKQSVELAEMRSKAEAMESDIQSMEMSNLDLKTQATAVAENVKNIEKQKVKFAVAEKHEGDRQQEAETKRAELDSQLQEAMVKEANMTSAAQSKVHREKFKAEGEKLEFEGKMKRDAHKLE